MASHSAPEALDRERETSLGVSRHRSRENWVGDQLILGLEIENTSPVYAIVDRAYLEVRRIKSRATA